MTIRCVAVVLAAGSSSRLGQPKQLLLYRGVPLVRHAAQVALEAGCDETLVIGPYARELAGLPVTAVDNPEAAEGMSSSIRLVVERAGGSRILFTVCDQPLVTSDHLRALLAIDAPIVATAYAQTIGVPAVFGPQYADELRTLRGDSGARRMIHAHRDEVATVRFEDAALDIDTIDDYQKL